MNTEEIVKNLDELKNLSKSQAENIEKLNETIADQAQEINTLKGKVVEGILDKAVTKPEIPKDAVEVNKKKWKFTVATFRLPGSNELIKAEEAALDETILDKILKIEGQGILTEYREKK